MEDSITSSCDATLLQKAEEYQSEERLFQAASCLKRISNLNLLTDEHRRILEHADAALAVKNELMAPHTTTDGWKKQCERHGKRDTVIWYKVYDENKIVFRAETCIESSLLNPLLAVLKESELYHTWMPRYNFPVKVGLLESVRLSAWGKSGQIIRVRIDMPFPFYNRECIQHGFAVDSINEDNAIILYGKSMDTGNYYEIDIPEVQKGYRRIDLLAGLVIRPCPADHVCLKKSKQSYPEGEKLILICARQQVDAKFAGVPISLINFFTRTAIGQQWGMFLKVAEEIRDGKRPEYQSLLKENKELYSWVEQRVQVMLDKMS